jgi:hypothetical protein
VRAFLEQVLQCTDGCHFPLQCIVVALLKLFIKQSLRVCCLDMLVFVLSLDFLRNQCEFFVWVENFKTQILKY